MGSGAGRFTEIFLKYGAIIVSVDFQMRYMQIMVIPWKFIYCKRFTS